MCFASLPKVQVPAPAPPPEAPAGPVLGPNPTGTTNQDTQSTTINRQGRNSLRIDLGGVSSGGGAGLGIPN